MDDLRALDVLVARRFFELNIVCEDWPLIHGPGGCSAQLHYDAVFYDEKGPVYVPEHWGSWPDGAPETTCVNSRDASEGAGLDTAGHEAWLAAVPHYSTDIADAWAIIDKLIADGAAPGLLHNDFGCWALAMDGIQNMPSMEDFHTAARAGALLRDDDALLAVAFDCETTFFVRKGMWFKTPAEAICRQAVALFEAGDDDAQYDNEPSNAPDVESDGLPDTEAQTNPLTEAQADRLADDIMWWWESLLDAVVELNEWDDGNVYHRWGVQMEVGGHTHVIENRAQWETVKHMLETLLGMHRMPVTDEEEEPVG